MDDNKVTLRTAIPLVTQTKARVPGATLIEVRAQDVGELASIHYLVDRMEDPVPRVGEHVLVSILQGAPPGWLELAGKTGEMIQLHLPSRSGGPTTFGVTQSDVVRLEPEGIAVFPAGDDRIKFRLQYPDATSAAVDLDADQATVLVCALLGILRRMQGR